MPKNWETATGVIVFKDVQKEITPRRPNLTPGEANVSFSR